LADAFELNNLIKNSELKIIDEAGHNPHRTHRQELSQILIDFFKK